MIPDAALIPGIAGHKAGEEHVMLQAALGKQCLSTMTSAPNLGFGSAKRPSMVQRAAAPGPGAYKLKPALGKPLHLLHNPQEVSL